jgi:hypothetical protein
MKRGMTDFGWRAGFESGALRPMSCTHRASRPPGDAHHFSVLAGDRQPEAVDDDGFENTPVGVALPIGRLHRANVFQASKEKELQIAPFHHLGTKPKN